MLTCRCGLPRAGETEVGRLLTAHAGLKPGLAARGDLRLDGAGPPRQTVPVPRSEQGGNERLASGPIRGIRCMRRNGEPMGVRGVCVPAGAAIPGPPMCRPAPAWRLGGDATGAAARRRG